MKLTLWCALDLIEAVRCSSCSRGGGANFSPLDRLITKKANLKETV